MKYYISVVLCTLMILIGISIFFPVKDSPKSSSPTGWIYTLSRVSPSRSTSTPTGGKTDKRNQTETPAVTAISRRSLSPTQTSVLGAHSTPTHASSITATPTPVPLFLTLTSPTDDKEVTVSTIAIMGKTVPNAEVFINDQTIMANASGVFSTIVNLEEGENLITISANNSAGTYNEKEIIITYNKP